MSNINKLNVTMTFAEAFWGWLYLIAQIFAVPQLLAYLNGLLSEPLSAYWMDIVYLVFNFVMVFAIFHRFLIASLTHAGKNLGKLLRGAILCFAVYWLANYAVDFLLTTFAPKFSNVNDSTFIHMARTNFIPTAIVVIVLVPIAEEVLYRGLLFHKLYNKNHTLAYVLSVLVFCAVHVLGYIGTVDYLTLGLQCVQYLPAALCLAWAYAETDCIFAPVLIHAVVNAMAVFSVR